MQKKSKQLPHGRELHPPKVECELVAYRDAFRGNIVENDKPAVFGTAWEATDGTRALMFSNATEREQNIVYRWAGEWQRLSLMPHAIRLVPLSK